MTQLSFFPPAAPQEQETFDGGSLPALAPSVSDKEGVPPLDGFDEWLRTSGL